MDAACAGLAADTVVISATTARACSDIVLRLARRVHRVRMPCCPRGLAFLCPACTIVGLAFMLTPFPMK